MQLVFIRVLLCMPAKILTMSDVVVFVMRLSCYLCFVHIIICLLVDHVAAKVASVLRLYRA